MQQVADLQKLFKHFFKLFYQIIDVFFCRNAQTISKEHLIILKQLYSLNNIINKYKY